MHKLFTTLIKIILMPALMALVVLAGCSLPVLGLPHASTPTPTANASIGTVAAARTEAVQAVYQTLTQAAALTPSATPPAPTATAKPGVKTRTPGAPTATKKATTKPPAPSPTANAYHCFITLVSPVSGSSITKGKNFDFKVTVRNDGAQTWQPSTVDFVYLSGPKFQKGSSTVKLTKDILPGQSVKLLVAMNANSARGTQAINWALEQGSGNFFCYVGVTVTIK